MVTIAVVLPVSVVCINEALPALQLSGDQLQQSVSAGSLRIRAMRQISTRVQNVRNLSSRSQCDCRNLSPAHQREPLLRHQSDYNSVRLVESDYK